MHESFWFALFGLFMLAGLVAVVLCAKRLSQDTQT